MTLKFALAIRIIDTHIHIWNPDRVEYAWLKNNTTILHRNYTIEELEKEREEAGITSGILVQAANNFEDTDWMLAAAARTDWISGVVGWLPLMNPALTEQAFLSKYAANNYFKGVRHLIHDEPDTQWLLQPEVLESLHFLAQKNIPYDLVGVKTEHIQTALTVAAKIPTLQMTFDHMNQPPIAKEERFGAWGQLMKKAASHSNFYVKISGLGTASGAENWTEEKVKPYIAFVLEHFGADRCFCGGDWPVSLLADNYTNTWSIYKNVLKDLLSAEEQEKVFYHNAKRFYQL